MSSADPLEKQIDDIFKTIDTYLNQKPIRKNLEADINKELKKIKKYFTFDSAQLTCARNPSPRN